MMTLYLLFEAIGSGKLGMNSRLRVSRRAAAQPRPAEVAKVRVGAPASASARQRRAKAEVVLGSR
jgi:D-alanyl-D-alanine carboxypeptidase